MKILKLIPITLLFLGFIMSCTKSSRIDYHKVPFAVRQDLFTHENQEFPSEPHAASLVELADGTILYSFNGKDPKAPIVETKWGARPANRIYLSKLHIGAEMWTNPVVLPMDEYVEIHNTILWYGEGRVFMFYTSMVGPDHSDSALDLLISEDDGITWSDPISVREEHGWMFGTKPLSLSNGDVILPIYKESSPNGVGFMISEDNFQSWEIYPSENSESWLRPGIMADIVEITDGLLMGYVRASGYTLKIISEDFGRTWIGPEPTSHKNPWSRIALIRLQNGNLLMAHNPTKESPRTPLRLSLSKDNGESWPYWVDIETNPDGRYDYPYLLQASDELIHLAYTHNDKKTMRHIVFNELYVIEGGNMESNDKYSKTIYLGGEIKEVFFDK